MKLSLCLVTSFLVRFNFWWQNISSSVLDGQSSMPRIETACVSSKVNTIELRERTMNPQDGINYSREQLLTVIVKCLFPFETSSLYETLSVGDKLSLSQMCLFKWMLSSRLAVNYNVNKNWSLTLLFIHCIPKRTHPTKPKLRLADNIFPPEQQVNIDGKTSLY